MQVADEQRWATMVSELKADEPGQNFLRFYEFWFDTADTLCNDEKYLVEYGHDGPVVAMRKALEMAETELGYLAVDWIGQMLCVAAMHWKHGADMLAQMTIVEQRVAEEAMARKLVSLQEQAHGDKTEPVDTVG